jgi:hypothetical protein
VLVVVLLASVVIATLTAGITGLLSHLDGATIPRALLRSGAAFGGTLLVLAALLALGTDVIEWSQGGVAGTMVKAKRPSHHHPSH